MSANELALRLSRPGFELDVDLQLPGAGITVLFGPSGSGKTTLLRCVAGLERAAGRVSMSGQAWQDDAGQLFLPTWRRALGYVFQEASLFEHLSVRGNLEFGLKRSAGQSARKTLDDAVQLLGIDHLLDRRPEGLSGGERQRVAIARALATRPGLLLLDEPLASLDAARRQDILPWLARLRDEWRLPMLYVTHSADELARLADHVVVLEQGRVRASGPVQQVLAAIDSPLAGDEAGVLLQGHVRERDTAWHLARVDFEGGGLWVRDGLWPLGQALRVRVLARDVSLALSPPEGSSIQNLLACKVDAITPDAHASQALVRLACGGSILQARVTQRAVHGLGLASGMSVWAQVKSVAIVD
jgi:molybdate transport system ATP-binding protein